MRPDKLTMTAFGPYRGVETIDFTDLGANRVFLIHGETGAGKTTILDAIVFALYGDTSGGERSAQQMRAESASPELATEVVYEFSLGDRKFRVTRGPRQELAKKRGEGVTLHQPHATFLELRAEGDAVIATGVSKVNDEVKALLGFSSEQFRQVVVLPQGKFRDLLAAGSDKREEILKQLFRTDVFADVERKLWERARQVKSAAAAVKAERSAQLGLVEASDDAELTALEAVAVTAEVQAAAAAVTAEAAYTGAATALAAAREAASAADSLQRTRAQVAQLEGRAEWVAQAQGRLDAASRAARVAPAVQQMRSAEAALVEATAAVNTASAAHADAAAEAQRLEVELAAEFARCAARDDARSLVHRLEGLAGPAAELAAATAREMSAAAALATAENDARAAADAVVAAKEGLEAAGLRAAETRDALARMDGLKDKAAGATRLAEGCRRLATVRAEVATATAAAEAAAVAVGSSEDACAAADRDAYDVEARWRAGRGAALAQTLADGEPCPVCGSQHHPNLAEPEPGAPDDAALERARRSQTEAREADKAARVTLADARTALESKLSAEAMLVEQLGDGAATEADKARLAAAACEQDVERLLEVVAAGDPDELVADARERLVDAEALKGGVDAAVSSANTVSIEARITASELRERVPEEVRDPAALASQLAAAKEASAALEAALASATAAHASAREAAAAASAAAESARGQLGRDLKAAETATAALAVATAEAGFAGIDELDTATMTPQAADGLAGELQEHHRLLAEARGALAQAERACASLGPATADIAGAEARAAEAEAEMKQAQGRRSDAHSHTRTFVSVRAQLAAIDERSTAIDEEYRVVGRLAEVASGQLSGAKVSFQRWVLGTYLDQVLEAATRRLSAMSKGRYRLVRDLTAVDGRRSGGLDLAVFDEFSGTDRPAVTLSGGESFLAALALALGLAETVQEFAGGTRLDTIFVDEGFGALDPDALDKAMDALLELQDSGRLVGVISHVPELRQVINARLEVTGGSAGSTTRFVVP